MKRGGKKQKTLGVLDKIKSPFCCAGSFDELQPFKIFFESEDVTGVLNFPQPHQQQLDKACKYARKSGFGKGHENVVDEGYRKAFEYLPEHMGHSNSLEKLISEEIPNIVAHQLALSDNVQADLIKLNIYTEGSFFKSHVDSPKKEAFGSLVVFLPCYFEGGALIINHGTEKVEYSFGGKDHLKRVNWVAFYNDCIHEITEVQKGTRLTLSYNLSYRKQGLKRQIFPHQEIVSCLLDLPEGNRYGYFCQHFYGNNALKDSDKNQLRLLKGKDAQLWVAAKHLNVKGVELRVIFREVNNYAQKEQDLRMFDAPPSSIANVKAGTVYGEEQAEDPGVYFGQHYGAKVLDMKSITWLNRVHDQSKYIYAIDGYYGNDYSINESYCELVILLVR